MSSDFKKPPGHYPHSYLHPSSNAYWDRLPSSKSPPPVVRYDQSVFVEDLRELVPLILYTIFALVTRLYKIGKANTVLWDEAHFGKFAGYYINQTFYFDVHPPLAKMLVGFAGLLSGFDGRYDFPSGQPYPPNVPYTTMRILLALPGIALVPIAWATALELGFTTYTRHIVTLMVLADLSWTIISRFILLDSMLLFFTFTTVYCLACFQNQRRYPFDFEWWFWLSMTGLSVGCVASVKWVGLFVTALVGAHTAEELWDKFGDLRMPYRVYARHWIARIVCLIGLPIMVYMLCFKIHFLVLNRSGPGDAQMSSLFQANLWGNDFARHPLEIAIGSKVTFKNMGYGGGLLHSHPQTYPVGSHQQQVTCYHYRDSNNDWVISPLLHEPAYNETLPIRFLTHGAVVRLVHLMSGRNLHTHNIAAPVTKLNNEVACYGNATIDDSNSYWVVEVVDDLLRGGKPQTIHTLSTRLRLRSLNLGCYLRAANAVLPQWGFKQVEVSCDKQNNPHDVHTYWNVESHVNGRLPPGDMKLMRSSFLHDFWHLNVAMMTSNNALIPDPDKQDAIASHPFDWPFLYSGMRMNTWTDSTTKFYLIGNPLVWWISAICLIIYGCSMVWYAARAKRCFNDVSPREWYQLKFVGRIGAGGWLLHYLPFLFMGRVTYLHHYLPTLWFGIITSGLILDHFVFRNPSIAPARRRAFFGGLACAIVGTGWWFRACAWGIDGPVSAYTGRQWRKSWNLYEDHLSAA
ncbi:hypothetical protein CROQUDRAFT_674442 [Cronartium quercuum f. sp. fusiforme G11]|uniref:Dolichyl-phosphate-mannose--protein mannosyltransferase n=1 Tax=Cronartium quercuum f. sp. fusiforme G11 TaxID=708437 RepID=A0A9P6NB66_9BASI|nr:hypothetical protein CROQUDRAFT_674442 [Cronartium quercuum f. sp. fusiforme G11]